MRYVCSCIYCILHTCRHMQLQVSSAMVAPMHAKPTTAGGRGLDQLAAHRAHADRQGRGAPQAGGPAAARLVPRAQRGRSRRPRACCARRRSRSAPSSPSITCAAWSIGWSGWADAAPPVPAGRPQQRAFDHPKGRALRRSMWPVYAAAIEEHFGSRLSRAEAEQLAGLLAKLEQTLRARPAGQLDPGGRWCRMRR